MEFKPGQRLSHYTLTEQIGQGGMGVVWQAEDAVLRRTVAIKMLPTDLLLDDEHRRMFLEEARLAASVSHAHIVQVYELGHEGGFDFIVMEYVDGRPLTSFLNGHPLAPERVVDYGLQVAQGLTRAHRKQLLHRDLKPGNLLVTADGELKIVDFGLAMLFERSDVTLTSVPDDSSAAAESAPTKRERVLAGTVPYMSPEQVRDEKLDARSDIFSFGIVLYEMTTGERPFRGSTISEILDSIVASRPVPPHVLIPRVPYELDHIIRKTLSARRKERYQSMDELAVDLRRLQKELETGQALLHADVLRASRSEIKPGGTRPTPTVPVTGLAALLSTTIHDAPELRRRLGNQGFQHVVARHGALFASVLGDVPGATILQDTADGFLACFATATEGVKAALRLQQEVAREEWDPEPPHLGMGLHIGELSQVESDLTGQTKVIGLAGDIAAQLAELALPNQLLVTRVAFDEARQSIRDVEFLGKDLSAVLRWMAHGRYLLQGSEEPREVFEVGAEGVAPLAPPPNSRSAQRSVSAEEEPIFGWRPAAGLAIPWRKGWQLDHQIGEGGFGEVWLARFPKTGELRVFKFCFDAHRLRAFKRELTLFRVLREALGDREDICKIYEVQLEEPPFYLESEYTELGDLRQWSGTKGGLRSVPLATRLDLVARIAEAVAAAHSVGILHKDIKPDNVLVYEAADGTPRPRLADFGIGAVADRAELEKRNIAMAGLTELGATAARSSTSGTPMYMPPESLSGGLFSIQGDVYALGVLFYQMVVGDLKLPLGPGWERSVPDELLREDIAACVDHEPQRRLANAAELAHRLRSREARRRARRQLVWRRRVLRIGAISSILGVALIAVLLYQNERVTRERDRANLEAKTSQEVAQFLTSLFEAPDPDKAAGNTVTAREILDRGAERIERELADQPPVQARMMNTMGRAYTNLGLYPRAESLLIKALELRRSLWGEQHPEVAESLTHLGWLYYWEGRVRQCLPPLEQALDMRERLLGDTDIETVWSRYYLGSALVFTDSIDAMLRGERLLALVLPVFEADPAGQRVVSWCLNDLAVLYGTFGKYPEALELIDCSLLIRREILPAGHFDMGIGLGNKAELFMLMDRLDGVQETIEEVQRCFAPLGQDHLFVAYGEYLLGELYRKRGDLDRARAVLDQARATFERATGLNNWNGANAVHSLALLHWKKGEFAAADSLFRETVDISAGLPASFRGAAVFDDYASFLAECGRDDEARPFRRRAEAIRTSYETAWAQRPKSAVDPATLDPCGHGDASHPRSR